jgi:elongation factor P
MVLQAQELRPGKTFELDGHLYSVLDYNHNKTARGSAVIKVKIRNINTGSTTEKSFRTGDKIEDVRIEARTMQYLYKDGDMYAFMDVESFDQIDVSGDLLGNALNYLIENMEVDLQVYKEKVIGVSLPASIILKVTYTEPGVKGDTVSNVTKPATLETGLIVQVPIFVSEGNSVKVDTKNNTYIERA